MKSHPSLSDGVRNHLRLRTEHEARLLTSDAVTVGTDLLAGRLDALSPSLVTLVCQAVSLRHCRLDARPTPFPVYVNRSLARETVDSVADLISLRADAGMLDLMQRRGLPHYVRQAGLAATRAAQTLDGTPGGPLAITAALDDAMDNALVVLAASRARLF